jgi:hypothetical protein
VDPSRPRPLVSWLTRDSRYVVQVRVSAYHVPRETEPKTLCGNKIPANARRTDHANLTEESKKFICARCDHIEEGKKC